MGILNDMGAVYVTTNTVSCDMTTEEDYDRYQGGQMAIAKSLDCICLALWACTWRSMAPLRYASKLEPFLSLSCTLWPPTLRNPRKGRDRTLPSGNTALGPFPSVSWHRQTVANETIVFVVDTNNGRHAKKDP